MATASVSITPECSICYECFETPKVLPCGHTFCLECLERYIGDKTETFPCPICQQDVKIPDGGAKMFITNFIVPTSPHLTDKTFSNVKYHCTCHRERQIDYYCLTCHCLLCHKCFLKEHKDHEYLDVECETAKEKATELVLTSKKFIQNKIKDLEETHSALGMVRETLQRFTEDACRGITKQTDTIIADIKTSRERIMRDIQNRSQESESELTKTGKKIKRDIKHFKMNLETNFPSLTKDCSLQILGSLEKIKELEELCKDVRVPSIQYLDWKETDFSLNIDMLGSAVLKQYHIPKLHESSVYKLIHMPQIKHESNKSYQFVFNINDIKKDSEEYYCQNKLSNHHLIWSCSVERYDGNLGIDIQLSKNDNPELDYCIMDGRLSILNVDDDSKTITKTVSNKRLDRACRSWWWDYPITWSELTDKNNGYLNSNGQFVVQFDITHMDEISWKGNTFHIASYFPMAKPSSSH